MAINDAIQARLGSMQGGMDMTQADAGLQDIINTERTSPAELEQDIDTVALTLSFVVQLLTAMSEQHKELMARMDALEGGAMPTEPVPPAPPVEGV